MAAARQSVNDFMRDVRARGVNGGTSSNVYGATLNTDNTTVQITKNGVVLFPKVLWPGTGSAAATDAGGQNQDTVDLLGGEGYYSTVSAQQFINSLL